MDELKRYYELLGLSYNASIDKVRKASIDEEERLQRDMDSADSSVRLRVLERQNMIKEAREIILGHRMLKDPSDPSGDRKEIEPVNHDSPGTRDDASNDISKNVSRQRNAIG